LGTTLAISGKDILILIFFVGYISLIGIHLETNVVGSGGIRKK
jgi:hypothetical protein